MRGSVEDVVDGVLGVTPFAFDSKHINEWLGFLTRRADISGLVAGSLAFAGAVGSTASRSGRPPEQILRLPSAPPKGQGATDFPLKRESFAAASWHFIHP